MNDFQNKIERSSLGTPEARRARGTISSKVSGEVVQRAIRMASTETVKKTSRNARGTRTERT